MGTPAGTPSIIATSRGPCDSPAVRTRTRPSSYRARQRGAHRRERGVEPRPETEGPRPLMEKHDESVDGETAGLASAPDQGRFLGRCHDVDHGYIRGKRD